MCKMSGEKERWMSWELEATSAGWPGAGWVEREVRLKRFVYRLDDSPFVPLELPIGSRSQSVGVGKVIGSCET